MLFSFFIGFCWMRLLLLLLCWLCIVVIFCFALVRLPPKTPFSCVPFDVPFIHVAYLYTFAHKKNKIRFFSSLFFVKNFSIFLCVRTGYLFIRCLRIGSTQTAPFHLMLSLTWNENIFHHPRFCHVLVWLYVYALCMKRKSKSFSIFRRNGRKFFFFPLSCHFYFWDWFLWRFVFSSHF